MIFNNADQPRDVYLDLHDTPLSDIRSLESAFAAATALVRDHQAELSVAPRNVAIYEVK